MSKPRGHDIENYTHHPGRQFGLEWSTDPGKCQLFVLSERATAVLRSMLQVFPKYYWVWGIEGPQRDWTQTQWDEWDATQAFVSELEGSLVAGCDLQAFIDEQRRLTAAIAGETITINGEEVDFSESGLIPTLRHLFIAPVEWTDDLGSILTGERTAAEILKTGLVGRLLDITPAPGEGDGLADITDEMLDKLQDRFVMKDSSLFNPLFDTKNITEALETLFRRDKLTDIELLPNVATILERALNTGDSGIIPELKALVQQLAIRLDLPPSIANWLKEQLEIKEGLSIADILLLMGKASMMAQNIDASTVVNVLNNNNCAPGTNGNGNGTGDNSKITLTDEGVRVEGDLPLLGEG